MSCSSALRTTVHWLLGRHQDVSGACGRCQVPWPCAAWQAAQVLRCDADALEHASQPSPASHEVDREDLGAQVSLLVWLSHIFDTKRIDGQLSKHDDELFARLIHPATAPLATPFSRQ